MTHIGLTLLAIILVPLGIWGLTKLLGLVGKFILRPIKDATDKVSIPAQFSIFDFVSLLVMLQVALGYALRFNERGTRAFFPQLVVYFLVAGVTIWLAGISLLSRAGIREPTRRGLFVVVLLPCTVIVLAGLMLVPSAWVYWFQESDNAELLLATVSGTTLLPFYILLISSIGVALGPWVLRRLADWIAAPTLKEVEAALAMEGASFPKPEPAAENASVAPANDGHNPA